ncbi:hypothetical protein MCUN1_001423 [Malassezia cuniculi]|uniref:Mitochondrial carrier n=1 Tax=Malassezia cuniculi TaxID=948313 RepID=A0AAF0EXL8_9BASI|nr:hypothetical protein MCUN1_001423 [Malassezia cuniculi]
MDAFNLVEFLAGTAGGVASVLVGHPFDTIKTRLQAQVAHSHELAPLRAAPRYTSAFHALATILREERVVGLFRGVTSPMIGVAAMNAAVFGFYDAALHALQGSRYNVAEPTLWETTAAGVVSGVGTALVTAPVDLLKIQQQVDASTAGRPSYSAILRRIWSAGGIRGVYQGFLVTALRDTGYGPYFGSYALINHALQRMHPESPLAAWEYAVSGAIAGIVGWLSTYWVDVIKTQVQAQPPENRRSIADIAYRTYMSGGTRAFFAGVGPTVLRAIPANAALFVVYEGVRRAL